MLAAMANAALVRRAPPEVEVEVHAAHAIRLDDAPNGRHAIILSSDRTLIDLPACSPRPGPSAPLRGSRAAIAHQVR